MWKTRLVFADGGGRLGNQLLNKAHLLAFTLEYEEHIKAMNLSFWPYGHLFAANAQAASMESVWTNEIVRIFRNNMAAFVHRRDQHRWQKILRILRWTFAKCFPKHSLEVNYSAEANLADTKVIDMIFDKRVLLLYGYGPRNWTLLNKHQNTIREQLTPHPRYIQPAMDNIGRIQRKSNIVVGVHIRQGDYAAWQQGRYYFTISQYVKKMKRVQALLQHQQVHFHIASSSISNKKPFAGLPVSFTSSLEADTHYIGDMYELSQCDYICGPPSTFSIWASFLGKVPFIPFVDTHSDSYILKNSLFDAIRDPYCSIAIH